MIGHRGFCYRSMYRTRYVACTVIALAVTTTVSEQTIPGYKLVRGLNTSGILHAFDSFLGGLNLYIESMLSYLRVILIQSLVRQIHRFPYTISLDNLLIHYLITPMIDLR